MTVATPQRFAAAQLHTQIISILTAWGMPAEAALTTADVMVDTDLSGIDSHGVSMLMMYERLLHEGRLKLDAQPRIVREAPAFAVVDADAGLGHPAAVHGMDLAMEKASACGIGAVTVANSYHFGALGYYVRMASQRGLVALVTTTTRTPAVSATGGTTPILGTNPIAFAAPRENGEALVVDISTSVVALNKVKAYALKGLDLPVGWVTDRNGETVTDAALAYSLVSSQQATVSPLGGPTTESGGHKGFGLSLMVHVLSGAFSGAALPLHKGETDNLGHFFLVIDPETVNPGGGTACYVNELLNLMGRDEPGVVMPGEPEAESRVSRSAQGIPIPESLLEHVQAICSRADVDFILTPVE